MARALICAFEHAGAQVDLASELRSRDGRGDARAQAALHAQAETECAELIKRGARAGWQAWVTYHNYYKAPDLLGPAIAAALDIPYLQIESSRARKRLGGAWDRFARTAEAASDAADVIFYLTKRDAEALLRDAPKGQQLIHLRPFLARDTLPEPSTGHGAILSVGMMRAGDKLASYELIAQTLALLPNGGWHLNIAGDGPARAQVAQLMAPFGEAVTFLGALDQPALARAYQDSAVMFWPGVNEAFGLVYLEAQAHGLPIIAQDRPGVRDVLSPTPYPPVSAGPAGMAAMLNDLLSHPSLRHDRAQAARDHVSNYHLLPAAAQTLRAGLARAGGAR